MGRIHRGTGHLEVSRFNLRALLHGPAAQFPRPSCSTLLSAIRRRHRNAFVQARRCWQQAPVCVLAGCAPGWRCSVLRVAVLHSRVRVQGR